jgi:xanthine dehydrogenase accessory factor
MSGWWNRALELAARGEAAALVTVCSVSGSAPREPGTRMLVWAESQYGTVGGGTLEFTIVDQARKLLASGSPHRFQSYPLGPLLGQCCGGRVGVLIERIDSASVLWLSEVAAAEAAGRPYMIHSTLTENGIVRRVAGALSASDLSGESVRLSDREGRAVDLAKRIDPAGLVIVERVDARPSVLMFGAGHVGKALAPIVATLPLRVQWFDNRPEFAVPGVAISSDLVARVEAAPPGALFLIFTQSHAVDYELTRAVLRRGDFLYCGLIGSTTKRRRFERRLIDDGIAPAMLTRLVCPIGRVGLASKDPAVLAVGIATELLLTVESRAAASPRALHAL